MVNLFFFVLVLHPEPPCVSQKWAIREISQSQPVSGFWNKASLHMYWARIDVSANRNGEVGGKCKRKMAMTDSGSRT